MAAEWRDVLPYLAALIMFVVGWVVTASRSSTLDEEQDHWRQTLTTERDNAVRECRRWQRYAQEMDIAHALLWNEWNEWGETMVDLVRAGGLKGGQRMPQPPNKSSVRFPTPPNGEGK